MSLERGGSMVGASSLDHSISAVLLEKPDRSTLLPSVLRRDGDVCDVRQLPDA
jgi:hypothetical protein